MIVRHPTNAQIYAEDVTLLDAVKILIELIGAGWDAVIDGEGKS